MYNESYDSYRGWCQTVERAEKVPMQLFFHRRLLPHKTVQTIESYLILAPNPVLISQCSTVIGSKKRRLSWSLADADAVYVYVSNRKLRHSCRIHIEEIRGLDWNVYV